MRPCDSLLGNCGAVGKRTAIRVVRRKREKYEIQARSEIEKETEKRAHTATRFQWKKEKGRREEGGGKR